MLSAHTIERALGPRKSPLPVFLRDDDGGWDDTALERLLQRVGDAALPIDLAVIPAAIDADFARLLDAARTAGTAVRFHQHGYCHVNHQPEGRRCEFGDARDAARQADDLSAGRQRLQAVLGSSGDPIFTPPWNRCAPYTIDVLARLGYRALSRDATATPLSTRLRELPVTIDWQRRRDGKRLSAEDFSSYVARALGNSAFCGVMLHHATLDDEEWLSLLDFVHELRRTEQVRFVHMQTLVEESIDD